MPHDTTCLTRDDRRHALRGLDALNLVLADVRDGLGPYLAIYLLAVRGPAEGWDEARIGLVMTLAGLAGLLAQTPAGALVDRSRDRRALLIGAAILVTLACVLLPWVRGFAAVATTQAVAAIAATVIAPALAAITLGVVGPAGFARRIGRNEACNHAGNAVAAGTAALGAWAFGPGVVFVLMGVLALLSIGATLMIPARAIDGRLARGLEAGAPAAGEGAGPSGLPRRLILFALLMAAFHLANAAMLPTVGQKLVQVVGPDHATSLVAACIVAAQGVMVPVALLAGRLAGTVGRKPVFLVAFGVLALRGLLYPLSDAPAWLLGVQLLDGVGAGIFGALFPVVVADLTRGSGRFNLAQGAVATAQGIGAALSASLAGAIIVAGGYSAAFLVLGAIAAAGGVGYLVLMPETRPAA